MNCGVSCMCMLWKIIAQVPENVLDVLQEICFPRTKRFIVDDQCEIFADVLSMSLRYQTSIDKIIIHI